MITEVIRKAAQDSMFLSEKFDGTDKQKQNKQKILDVIVFLYLVSRFPSCGSI